MRRQRGFTLIELLIALALVAMMSALLYAGLRFAGDAWDRVEVAAERDVGMQLTWRFVSELLSRARPVNGYVSEKGETRFLFSGFGNAMEFVAPMPAYLGGGGLYILRLQEMRNGRVKGLGITRWVFHPEVLQGDADLPEWDALEGSETAQFDEDAGKDDRAYYSQSMILDQVKEVKFEYFGPDQVTDQSATWQSEWLEKNDFPWLVRLQVEDEAGAWPDLVMAVGR